LLLGSISCPSHVHRQNPVLFRFPRKNDILKNWREIWKFLKSTIWCCCCCSSTKSKRLRRSGRRRGLLCRTAEGKLMVLVVVPPLARGTSQPIRRISSAAKWRCSKCRTRPPSKHVTDVAVPGASSAKSATARDG
jgi:hypothetical protein